MLLSVGGLALLFTACALWLSGAPRSRAARLTALFVASFYLLASTYVVPQTVAALLTRHVPRFEPRGITGSGTAIVLLGAGSQHIQGVDSATSVMFPAEAARVLEAARVFARLSPDWVISSGGADPVDDQPSSIVMRDALVQLGVPAARIVLESTSRTTRDEAILIAPLLKSLNVQRTILVTSAIHMPRSLGAFRAAGVAAIPAPATDPGAFLPRRLRWRPSETALRFSSEVMHECVGLPYYAARGWWTR